MQENQVGQQTGSTGTGPGTASGAAATGRSGGRETVSEPVSTTTTTTTTQDQNQGRYYEQRAAQPTGQTQYARGQQPQQSQGGGHSMMEHGSTTAHGGLMLTLAGLLTFLVGLAFIVRHHFYHSIGAYAYNWGISNWGWALLILGIVTFAVGAAHLLGIPTSRPFGIVLAVLTVIAGFMIIPFYAFWAFILVAMGLAALWGLAHGHERHEAEMREREREHHQFQQGGGYGGGYQQGGYQQGGYQQGGQQYYEGGQYQQGGFQQGGHHL